MEITLWLITVFMFAGSVLQKGVLEYIMLCLYKVVRYCGHNRPTPDPLVNVLLTEPNNVVFDLFYTSIS